jgi:uncharacterized membrane protein
LADSHREPGGKHIGRYIFIGLLTIAPLWVTWLVFQFVLSRLSRAGSPGVVAIATMVRPLSPTAYDIVLHPAFSFGLAVVITLLGLYLLGRATTLVIGRRLIATVEALLKRIPLAHPIYTATKRFIAAMREQPVGHQRVVFINFPSREMKTVGLVTKVMKDADTGRDVAAVYVPTSPNPTSGYIELVPVERLTETNWTIEEAMRFIMTGGTNAPDTIRFGEDGFLPAATGAAPGAATGAAAIAAPPSPTSADPTAGTPTPAAAKTAGTTAGPKSGPATAATTATPGPATAATPGPATAATPGPATAGPATTATTGPATAASPAASSDGADADPPDGARQRAV